MALTLRALQLEDEGEVTRLSKQQEFLLQAVNMMEKQVTELEKELVRNSRRNLQSTLGHNARAKVKPQTPVASPTEVRLPTSNNADAYSQHNVCTIDGSDASVCGNQTSVESTDGETTDEDKDAPLGSPVQSFTIADINLETRKDKDMPQVSLIGSASVTMTDYTEMDEHLPHMYPNFFGGEGGLVPPNVPNTYVFVDGGANVSLLDANFVRRHGWNVSTSRVLHLAGSNCKVEDVCQVLVVAVRYGKRTFSHDFFVLDLSLDGMAAFGRDMFPKLGIVNTGLKMCFPREMEPVPSDNITSAVCMENYESASQSSNILHASHQLKAKFRDEKSC